MLIWYNTNQLNVLLILWHAGLTNSYDYPIFFGKKINIKKAVPKIETAFKIKINRKLWAKQK